MQVHNTSYKETDAEDEKDKYNCAPEFNEKQTKNTDKQNKLMMLREFQKFHEKNKYYLMNILWNDEKINNSKQGR